MKKRIPTFFAGMLTTALIGSLGITALAATNQLTITVDPINIQVNGATFAPKDAQGASVPVFALNGTTYAPLRALAEAYGLEVGYDAKTNMATVGEVAATPDTTTPPNYTFDYSYEEFMGLWDIDTMASGGGLAFVANDSNEVLAWWESAAPDTRTSYLVSASTEKLTEFGLAENLSVVFKSEVRGHILASVWSGEVNYRS